MRKNEGGCGSKRTPESPTAEWRGEPECRKNGEGKNIGVVSSDSGGSNPRWVGEAVVLPYSIM